MLIIIIITITMSKPEIKVPGARKILHVWYV